MLWGQVGRVWPSTRGKQWRDSSLMQSIGFGSDAWRWPLLTQESAGALPLTSTGAEARPGILGGTVVENPIAQVNKGNTREENRCHKVEFQKYPNKHKFQTYPNKHRWNNHFVYFYPKRGGTGSGVTEKEHEHFQEKGSDLGKVLTDPLRTFNSLGKYS